MPASVHAPDPSSGDFVARHIGPRDSDQAKMLADLGFASLDDLIDVAVPAGIRTDASLQLPDPLTESEAAGALAAMAARNSVSVPMIGLGYYPSITPPVIRRNVLEDPAWYTA